MTETRPPAEATEPGPTEPPVEEQPEPTGLAGWLSTSDHKKVGRLWLGTSLAFLLAGSVLAVLLGAERVDSGLQIFDGGSHAQVHALHQELGVFLFLLPFFVGLATYVVPLQVGARAIAFPRGAAAAYWTYLLAGAVLVAAYLADGGIDGDSAVGTDLYLLSVTALLGAVLLGVVCVLTTLLGLRAPGMSLLRTPAFSWSVLVGGGLILLTAPVLVARLVQLYVTHHFGGSLAEGAWEQLSWFWSVPQTLLLVVPAAGVALAVVPVMAGVALRSHGAGLVVVGLMGVLGFGAFAPGDGTFDTVDDLLLVLLGLAGVIPALALLGLLGDTVRRGRFRFLAANLLALGAAVHLLVAALAGAVLVIEPLDLVGTAWAAGHLHATLYGAAAMAALAALWFWAPKIWGVRLREGAGLGVFGLTFVGALLLAAPDLVTGLVQDQAQRAARFDEEGLTVAMNVVSAAGAALTALGVLVAVAEVAGRAARRRGAPVDADPWGGHTLEWATASPPPRDNFSEPVAPVASATPLLAPPPEVAG